MIDTKKGNEYEEDREGESRDGQREKLTEMKD